MSEEQFLAEDPSMIMDEDSEANNEDQIIASGEQQSSTAETEGSKIDASKNEEDEGWAWNYSYPANLMLAIGITANLGSSLLGGWFKMFMERL